MTRITSDDEYKMLLDSDDLSAQYRVVRCSVCGSIPELWEHKERSQTWSKVLMCSNSERLLPEEEMLNDGCPMFMPGMDFYKATRREAIDLWNKWHEAMTAQRRERLA
jgi:hypothetical protein